MWFKSESRGRSHGEHKSNTEGGESKYVDHVPENQNYCAKIMVMMITKMWIHRDKLTEIIAKEGGGSLSNKHLHRLHHRHLPHHQVAVRFHEMMPIMVMMVGTGLMTEMMMFLLMTTIMMALMKLFRVIPAKWIMEMDVCCDLKQNKSWRAKSSFFLNKDEQ